MQLLYAHVWDGPYEHMPIYIDFWYVYCAAPYTLVSGFTYMPGCVFTQGSFHACSWLLYQNPQFVAIGCNTIVAARPSWSLLGAVTVCLESLSSLRCHCCCWSFQMNCKMYVYNAHFDSWPAALPLKMALAHARVGCLYAVICLHMDVELPYA